MPGRACQDVSIVSSCRLEPDDVVFLHEQDAGAAFSVQSNFKVITPENAKMNIAFVGNTGHFGNELELAGSESLDGKKDVNVKPQKTFFVFPFGHGMIVPASGLQERSSTSCTRCAAHRLCRGTCRFYCFHG